MSRSPAPARDTTVLTEREHQVLTALAGGHTNSEIGRHLYLSEDTVKTHLRRIYRKLGARDRAHAVALAYQRGLLTMPAGSTPVIRSTDRPDLVHVRTR